MINAGIPGEVSAAGLKRLPEVLDDIRPELLILCHGGNDILRKTSRQALQENLKAMVAVARARGVPVLMLAVPQPGLLLSPPPLYAEVAEEMKVLIEEDVLADILTERSLKSDTIHPNAAGYRRMAEAVLERMREAGAIR